MHQVQQHIITLSSVACHQKLHQSQDACFSPSLMQNQGKTKSWISLSGVGIQSIYTVDKVFLRVLSDQQKD